MTRREWLEKKLKKRSEWAESAKRKGNASIGKARDMARIIPFGQPILVGHHSECRDRRYRGRIDSAFSNGFSLLKKAERHESRAQGIAEQLDGSVFHDDHDAVQKLEERIAEREKERAYMKAVNFAYRRKDIAGLASMGLDYSKMRAIIESPGFPSWDKQPYASFTLKNRAARIRADKKNLEEVKRRQKITAAAATAPGGLVICRGETWCSITFAEKPGRSILNELRDAGFHWGQGSWNGPIEKIPAAVLSAENTPQGAP